MATTLTYNGIVLHNVVTREYDCEARYDSSGTDLIGQIVKITVTGVLHSSRVASGAPSYVDFAAVGRIEDVPLKTKWLREQLSQPRKTLVLKIGNTEIVRCEPATQANLASPTTDRDNGPKPTMVRVTHIAGDKVMRVSFSITCWFANCSYLSASDYVDKAPALVVNNRWSVKESMDDNYFLSRTISGHIRLSSSLASTHAYKSLCVPPLEQGFARKHIDFEESATGLEANYSVTDKQVTIAAPFPLTKFEATHTEGTNDSLAMNSSMHVTCWGDPHTNKADMLVRAVQIANSRLNFDDPKRNNYIFSNLTIVDHVGEENRLELHVAVRRWEKEQRTVFDLAANQIGKEFTLPDLPNAPTSDENKKYDFRQSRRPAIWGYDHGAARNPVQSFLLHCYLQTPCSTTKGHWEGGPNTAQPDPKKPPEPSVSGTVVEQVTPEPPEDDHSEEHEEAIYTHCRLSSRYVTTGLIAHMPLAYVGESSGSRSASTVTLGKGLCRRVIQVDAERVGKWPLIPSPEASYTEGDNGGSLIDYWVEPNAPTLAPGGGGKKVYRVTAYYLYGMDRPPTGEEAMHTGKLPFTKLTQADTEMKLSDTYSTEVGP